VATLFTEPAFGKPFVGLLADSQHDPGLADALHGGIYHRLLISHQPLSAEYARTVVDEVFVGLQAPGGSADSGELADEVL
jgi:hypothetical protein